MEAISVGWMDWHAIKQIFVYKKIACATSNCHLFNHGMSKTILNSKIWELKNWFDAFEPHFSNSYFFHATAVLAEYKPGASFQCGCQLFIDNIRPMGGFNVGWAHLLLADHRAIGGWGWAGG